MEGQLSRVFTVHQHKNFDDEYPEMNHPLGWYYVIPRKVALPWFPMLPITSSKIYVSMNDIPQKTPSYYRITCTWGCICS